MTLEELGFDATFQTAFRERAKEGFSPVRIISETKGLYTVRGESLEASAEPTGRFLFDADGPESMPAVGDWAIVTFVNDGTHAIIHDLLPRITSIVRKEAGKRSRSQVVAANVDIVFIVQGLDGNFNERRLERYCVAVKAGGAKPVVLLSKRDLLGRDDFEDRLTRAHAAVPGVPVHPYSALTGEGLDAIQSYISPATTICFIGSSGVGKSTLINRLSGGEVQVTAEVRQSDSKGRHITSRRDMLFLPNGGMLIDTPGMREFGLWDEDADPDDSFPEIASLAVNCRFRDCTHVSEPGCAVTTAVRDGVIDERRYESYLKLLREAEYIAIKKADGIRAAKKKREKHYSKYLKEIYRLKGKL